MCAASQPLSLSCSPELGLVVDRGSVCVWVDMKFINLFHVKCIFTIKCTTPVHFFRYQYVLRTQSRRFRFCALALFSHFFRIIAIISFGLLIGWSIAVADCRRLFLCRPLSLSRARAKQESILGSTNKINALILVHFEFDRTETQCETNNNKTNYGFLFALCYIRESSIPILPYMQHLIGS